MVDSNYMNYCNMELQVYMAYFLLVEPHYKLVLVYLNQLLLPLLNLLAKMAQQILGLYFGNNLDT